MQGTENAKETHAGLCCARDNTWLCRNGRLLHYHVVSQELCQLGMRQVYDTKELNESKQAFAVATSEFL